MATGQVSKPVQRFMRAEPLLRAALCCGLCSIAFVISPLTQAAPAQAQSLRQALANAYRYNPRLDAARARLRARDEDVPQALAGWRPVITGSSDYGYETTKTKPRSSSSGRVNSWGYSLNLKQNLFDGFQSTSRLHGAEASVRAERETLRKVEQEVLLRGVKAYMNVLRDLARVRLHKNNVYVLSEALRAARARRREHDITRTDVAQSRARRARAVSSLDEARAQLKTTQAQFRLVIGKVPQKLRYPSYRSRLIPSTLRSALKIAQDTHPQIIAAKFLEQAERFHVDKVRGELLPDVSVEAHYGKRFNGAVGVSQEENASITGRITVPFYRGGDVHSRVRQAKHLHVARLQEIEQERQTVEAGVMAAWSKLRAARSRLRSDHVQVEASRTALEGVREEEKVGQRTIIELLNAQQEYLGSKVTLTGTRRDLVVAAYTMIAAVGRLNVQDLQNVAEVYDPEDHYFDVREQRIGTSITARNDEERRDRHQRDDDAEWRDDEALLGARAVTPGRARRTARQSQRRQNLRRAVRDPHVRGKTRNSVAKLVSRRGGQNTDALPLPLLPSRRRGALKQSLTARLSGDQSDLPANLPANQPAPRPANLSAHSRPQPVLAPEVRNTPNTGSRARREHFSGTQTENETDQLRRQVRDLQARLYRQSQRQTQGPRIQDSRQPGQDRPRSHMSVPVGASPIATGSVITAPPARLGSVNGRIVQLQDMTTAPPTGFRGGLKGSETGGVARPFRAAADISVYDANRQMMVIRGARLD